MPTSPKDGPGVHGWQKWKKKFGQRTRVEEDTNYHLTEYKFFDQHDEEIKL